MRPEALRTIYLPRMSDHALAVASAVARAVPLFDRKTSGKGKGKAKSGGRRMRDMKPVLLQAMKDLTGQDFFLGASARDWADENQEMVATEQKALNDVEAKQKADAEALDD